MRHAPQVFPQTLVARPLADGCSAADLLKDLPQMEDVSAQPNVSVVDIGTGEGEENLGGEEFGRAVEAAGYGLTPVTSSVPAEQQPSAAIHARILMDKFHCVDATNGESGRDEIYWAMSSGADAGHRHAQRTGEYGATSTGDWHTFHAHERTLFDGAVTNAVACHIACWEADDSTSGCYEEMGRKLRIISEELAKFSNTINVFSGGRAYGSRRSRHGPAAKPRPRPPWPSTTPRCTARCAAGPSRSTSAARTAPPGPVSSRFPDTARATPRPCAPSTAALPRPHRTGRPLLRHHIHRRHRLEALAMVPGLSAACTHHEPALATLNNVLYLAYREAAGGRATVLAHDGTRWNTLVRPSGNTPAHHRRQASTRAPCRARHRWRYRA
ncbi:hypothetical protein ACFWC9_11565 [Streptomyces goshikiensis]|uniref:hypothetical protein n=1 Tax=Streptomyces goshikiensis TaxID=1942 RepID=UPI00369169CD